MPLRLATRTRDDTWRVAMVVPLQGPAGLFGPSCEAITDLAVHELNESGGNGPGAPALNNAAESCYEGLHTLAELVRRAGTPELPALNAAIDGVAYHGPRGTIEFRGQQADQHVHLAVADGYDFEVLTRL